MSKTGKYQYIIENMTWSYSRICSFEDCPYRWFLTYLLNESKEDRFYSSYGKFMHELLAKFYSGEYKKNELPYRFITGFSSHVLGDRPNASIVQKYIHSGKEYLENFDPIPCETLYVEKNIKFKFDKYNFTCFVDYIGQRDGRIYLVDHKSRKLKQRSNRKNKTENDKTIDSMMRQLYVYSEAVKNEFGKYPDMLAINSFGSNTFIEEPFNIDTFNNTKDWVLKTIHTIEKECDFSPRIEYFPCKYICDVSNKCCYKQDSR